MNTSSRTLVVLAAGIGSRYGGLKQIDRIGPSGEIVIDYSVYDALRAGFTKVVFVIRREIEADFRAIVEPHFADRVEIAYAYQELVDLPAGFAVPAGRTKPWGTAHAIYTARHSVTTSFAVINADDFYGRTSFDILAERLSRRTVSDRHFCMVGYRLGNTLSEHGDVARGVCEVDADGRLIQIHERHRIRRDPDGASYFENEAWNPMRGDEIVSMNLWGLTPAVFGLLGKAFVNFLPTVAEKPTAEFQIPKAITSFVHNEGASVDVLPTSEKWLGVTYPQDKALVVAGIRNLIDKGVYPDNLWSSRTRS